MIERLIARPGLLAAAAQGFVWQEHTRQIVMAALLSMVPTFEGRYAVTVALGMGMPAVFSFLLALVCSSLPVPFILLLLRPVLDWFYTLPIKPVRKFAAWLERHAEKKRLAVRGHPGAGHRRVDRQRHRHAVQDAPGQGRRGHPAGQRHRLPDHDPRRQRREGRAVINP